MSMNRNRLQPFMVFFGIVLLGPSLVAHDSAKDADLAFLWDSAVASDSRLEGPSGDQADNGALPDSGGKPELGSLMWSNEQNAKTTAKPNPNGLGPRMFDPNAMQNDYGLWFEADLLFWQSNVGSLDYAVDSKSTTRVTHGHVKEPEFDWDWGFKLGVGYKMPHDKWDLFVNYTYVHAHAHGSTHKDNGAVYPIWANSFGFTGDSFYATNAKAEWHANLNMADIELGRTCFAGRWLSLRPFIGVRGLVINQDYNLRYSGGTAFPGDTDKVSMDNDFWGVGLRVGLDTLWGLGAGFGIYGNGSASLLSGHFDVHEKEKLKNAGTHRLNIGRDVDNVVVAADLALGLQWDYLFSKERYHFGVKMGWEFNVFFDQNQLFNFMSSTNPGAIDFKNDDLSFQGLTLGFRFDF